MAFSTLIEPGKVDWEGRSFVMPLEAFLEFSSSDVEASRQHMSAVFSEHRLDVISPSSMHMAHSFVELRRTALSYLEYGTNVTIAPSESDYYVVHVPTKGTLAILSDQNAAVAKCGQTFVSSPMNRMSIEYGETNGTLLLRISRSLVEHRLSVLLDRPISQRVRFSNTHDMATSGKVAAWLRQFMFIVNELELGEGGLENLRWCGDELEISLINSLLFSHPHNYSELLENGAQSIAPYYVKAAERFIRDQADFPITADDIVEASGISKRALYLGFNRFRETTPMMFLQRVRLENVYQDIVSARTDESITQVAIRRGFTQLGRFSQLFRNAYGVLPSELLRRHRSYLRN